jgi:hypothetical protein
VGGRHEPLLAKPVMIVEGTSECPRARTDGCGSDFNPARGSYVKLAELSNLKSANVRK